MGVWAIPGGWVEFRALIGSDERSIEGTSIFDVLALINRLNVARPGMLIAAGNAAALSSAARDRALAALYRQIYGNAILSSPTCRACDKRFDLSFGVSDLLERYPVEPLPHDGVYQTATGVRFRLPTGVDELAVAGLQPTTARRELLDRCALGSDTPPEGIEAAMEQVAPLLAMDLEANCPECGATQMLDFDMGLYLLRRLIGDKQRLPGEVHMLAMAYGWGHQDILSLTRTERKAYIALIEASLGQSRTRGVAGSRRRRI